MARLGERLTVVRPGYVVGPHERAGLLTYWVRKAAGPAPVAVPALAGRPAQMLDVRDLARLVVLLLEDDRPGAYNAVGPSPAVSFVDVSLRAVTPSLAAVPEAGLDFPLRVEDPAWDVCSASAQQRHSRPGCRAPRSGQRWPTDRGAWDQGRGEPPLASGMSEEQERAVLAGA